MFTNHFKLAMGGVIILLLAGILYVNQYALQKNVSQVKQVSFKSLRISEEQAKKLHFYFLSLTPTPTATPSLYLRKLIK